MGFLVILIPVVAIVMVFLFVTVASWSEGRTKEREAFYRHETYRKMLDDAGQGAAAVEALMDKEELRYQQRRTDGMRLGGLITTAVGVGISTFLYVLNPADEPVWVVGVIPLLIGLVLIIYGFGAVTRPRTPGD